MTGAWCTATYFVRLPERVQEFHCPSNISRLDVPISLFLMKTPSVYLTYSRSGWALCGHGAAPGEAPDESALDGPAPDEVDGTAEDEHATTSSISDLQDTCNAQDPGNIHERADSHASDAKDASMIGCVAKRRGRRRSRRKGGLPVDHVLQVVDKKNGVK